MFNNFQAFNNFQQAYQMYATALQYISDRDRYMNDYIQRMENEVKFRLRNMDKIISDYRTLYNIFQTEAVRYSNNKAIQDKRITVLEDEVNNLQKLLKEIKLKESQAVKQTKAEMKEKVSSSAQTESINDNYTSIDSKKPIENTVKVKNANPLLTDTQKTKDDHVDEFFKSKETAKTQAKSRNKLMCITNGDNINGINNDKKQIKVELRDGSNLLNQYPKSNDLSMNSMCVNLERKAEDKTEDSTKIAKQSKRTVKSNVNNISDREIKSRNKKNTNLIVTKGKNWNNHDVNTWLEQKLNLNVKDGAWKEIVFGEYRYIQFNDFENKQFVWKQRDKWEEEGVWMWFEC